MSVRIGKPDRSKAGSARGTIVPTVRAVPLATRATSADAADVAVAVDVSGSRGAALNAALLATVEDGKIIPVSIDEFDTRYGGGPSGGITASAAMVRGLGC